MKKLRKFLFMLTALAALAFALAGCSSTKAASDSALATSVASVDKYGNVTLASSAVQFTDLGFDPGDIVTVNVDGKNMNVPVGTNYSDVDRGQVLVRVSQEKNAVSLAINMGNFSKTFNAVEKTPVAIGMKKKGGYLLEYNIRHLQKKEDRGSYATDEIYANFRAVKAGAIAENRLYRSCDPVAGDARGPYADKLAQQAGIKTVINLADTAEDAATNYGDAPYYADLAGKGSVVFLAMGVDFNDPAFLAKLHDGLVFLADHAEGPYLVHCTEGKDRAGFVCAVLEALCGATLDEIVADYMESFENYYGVQKGSQQYEMISKTVLDELKSINGGKKVTDSNAAKAAESYLTEKVGLTADEIARIKENLEK